MEQKNEFLGKHVVVELYQCSSEKINDVKFVENTLNEAANIGNFHPIKSFFHKFGEIGVSGVIVIEESHISIHTWPEHCYAAVDIFACGENVKIEDALLYILLKFESKRYSANELSRGNVNELKNGG